jgi:hypothetical protein
VQFRARNPKLEITQTFHTNQENQIEHEDDDEHDWIRAAREKDTGDGLWQGRGSFRG